MTTLTSVRPDELIEIDRHDTGGTSAMRDDYQNDRLAVTYVLPLLAAPYRRLRVIVRIDHAHARQGHGKAEVWTTNGWTEVAHLVGEELGSDKQDAVDRLVTEALRVLT